MAFYDIVIVGAGIAGISAIKKIREFDKSVSILLVSNEERLPYKRTKINKHIAERFSKNQFSLFNEEWYQDHNIKRMYGQVQDVDTSNKTIKFFSNEIVSFNKLLLAIGAEPFIPDINGIESDALMPVRYAHGVELLQSRLDTMNCVLVIGGGVEGIETAFELKKLGKEVHIADSNKNALAKLFPENISSHIFNALKNNGVFYYSETRVNQAQKVDDKYVVNIHGNILFFDGVIVCAGTRPNLALAKQSKLKTNKGILVNKFMQTSHSDVFAAGDVAEHENGLVTGLWHPAEYQGFSAGLNMINLGQAYSPVPLRLKTSVFGEFYFSANYIEHEKPEIKTIAFENNKVWGELYMLDSIILGITMMNDKVKSKAYYSLVANKDSLNKFKQVFPTYKIIL